MITSPTVLLLGAGASIPYGFPSGEALASEVQERFNSTVDDLSRLSPTTRSVDFRDFADSFRNSGLRSVDAFLEHRPEFIDAGKVVIAYHLVPREKPVRLSRYGEREYQDTKWYNLLWERIRSRDLVSFRENQLSVITFNYDRSLDEFLFRALCSVSSEEPEACADALSSIPIIHLHGQLGPLPWQATGKPHREYSQEITRATLRIAAEGIRVVTEDIGGLPEFQEAKQLLRLAKNIYVMGFGFLKENIERLELGVLPVVRSRRVIRRATCFGLMDAEIDEAKSLLGEGWDFAHSVWDAESFLRGAVHWHREAQR